MKNIAIFLILLISGCAAKGPSYQEKVVSSGNDGVIYFYRQKNLYLSGEFPYVFVDGKKVFTLKNGGYNFVVVPPGKHEFLIGKKFTWSAGDITSSVNVEAGKSYYIKLSTALDNDIYNKIGLVTSGVVRVYQVAEEQAKQELPTKNLSQ